MYPGFSSLLPGAMQWGCCSGGRLALSCCALWPQVPEGVWTQASHGMFLNQPLIWPPSLICLRLQVEFTLQTKTWVMWPAGYMTPRVGGLLEISKIF